jgi:hypothetical protein
MNEKSLLSYSCLRACVRTDVCVCEIMEEMKAWKILTASVDN